MDDYEPMTWKDFVAWLKAPTPYINKDDPLAELVGAAVLLLLLICLST